MCVSFPLETGVFTFYFFQDCFLKGIFFWKVEEKKQKSRLKNCLAQRFKLNSHIIFERSLKIYLFSLQFISLHTYLLSMMKFLHIFYCYFCDSAERDFSSAHFTPLVYIFRLQTTRKAMRFLARQIILILMTTGLLSEINRRKFFSNRTLLRISEISEIFITSLVKPLKS